MIWTIGTSISTLQHAEALELAHPPGLGWPNFPEFVGMASVVTSLFPDHEPWELPHAAFNQVPTPQLKVTDPSYTPNYFAKSMFHFVSERLQTIFQDATDRVRFRPIDTSQSVPAVQAVGYQMMDIIAFGNPWDTERMPGAERDTRQPDGSLKREWVLDWRNLGGPNHNVPIFYRDDFVPPAPIFRATGSMWSFVTDEMADHIQRAGIVDIAFLDVTNSSPDVDSRFRKLP